MQPLAPLYRCERGRLRLHPRPEVAVVSATDAAESLERLGLSRYEARVFVALQQLGGGTAQEVADLSDVPRSQVYGAAEDLAERGLVELVEASPKRYRPVSLATAREVLTERLERETVRAFEALAAVREDHTDEAGGEGVSTLRGRHAIEERVRDLLGRAESLVVYVVPAPWAVDEAVADQLRGLAAAGVAVTVVSEHQEVAARFEGDPVAAFAVDGDQMGEMTGRTLLVDEATVLLSVVEEGADETALWTAETSIGRILGQFVEAGMEAGMENQ
jgi:sugar-specific transcriptional regulator TrmB